MATKAAKRTAAKKRVTTSAPVPAKAPAITPEKREILAAARVQRKRNLTPQCALDGSASWTETEKNTFLQCLEASGNVSAAARTIGKKARAANLLRNKDQDFAEAWAAALEAALDALEGEVLKRATQGVTRNKYYGGKVIGTDVFHADQLAMFLLRAHRPDIYGKPDPDAQPLPETEEEFRQRIGERLQRLVAEERGGLVVDLVSSQDERDDDQ